LETFKAGSDLEMDRLIHRLRQMEKNLEKVVAPREKWFGHEIAKVERALPKQAEADPRYFDEPDTKLLQSLSYTIFDTILFCITNGQSPDFTLISQSVLFSCVYNNISRGYSSYLFRDVPPSGIAAIKQGRKMLEAIREEEVGYLDTEENWEKYAPIIQRWWINVALPLVFGEMDSDWAAADFPNYREMKDWSGSDLEKLATFPSIYDLMEMSKTRSAEISARYSFKQYMDAI